MKTFDAIRSPSTATLRRPIHRVKQWDTAALGGQLPSLARENAKLGITVNTVLTYRKRAYAKLGVGSQNEIFRLCLH